MSEKSLSSEYIKPFIQSISNVSVKMLNMEVESATLSSQEELQDTSDLVALVGLSGPIRGIIGLGMPAPTAFAFASKLLATEIDSFTDEVPDAVAEVVNMVAGGAKAHISEMVGETLELTLPTVFWGEGFAVHTPSTAPWVEISFTSTLGPFVLRLSLQERAQS